MLLFEVLEQKQSAGCLHLLSSTIQDFLEKLLSAVTIFTPIDILELDPNRVVGSGFWNNSIENSV